MAPCFESVTYGGAHGVQSKLQELIDIKFIVPSEERQGQIAFQIIGQLVVFASRRHKKARPQWVSLACISSLRVKYTDSGCLGGCAQARTAQLPGNHAALLHHTDFLDVDIPAATCGLARPRPVVSKLRTLAALLTLGHCCYPLNRKHSLAAIAAARCIP